MKTLYAILFLCISSSLSAQIQINYAADQYFKKYGYVKSAELYEKIYEKGNKSKKVLSRLGDSYYYNNKFDQANKWYNELFTEVPKAEIESEYYYRYIQTLKSLGKYTEANEILTLSKNNNKGIEFDRIEAPKINSEETELFENITNLEINSKYSDFNNIIKGNQLYVSSTRPKDSIKKYRKYGWNKQPYYNMFKVSMDKVIADTELENLNGKLNGKYHDAASVITKDGKTMYFTRDNSKGKRQIRIDGKKVSNLKIFRALYKNDKWQCVKELPFNNKRYSNGHPILSPDEKYLYFVSDRPGGYGMTDIYRVEIKGEDGFGEPENLGKEINSIGKEMFPFVTAKNEIYFSSDGHTGYGGLDIFKSEIKEKSYTTPVNLGNQLNSKSDDFSLVFTEDLKKGFFTSNRTGGKGDDDVYSFNITDNDKVCEKKIEGYVYNQITKKPLPNAAIQLLDANGNIVKTIISDQNGFYDLGVVTCDKTSYKVYASKTDYNKDSLVFTTENSLSKIELEAFLLPKEIKIDANNFDVHINPIYFDFDKFNIREDAAAELNKVVKVMKDFPEIKLRIESHTDSRGNDRYNEQLSDNRAKSSASYIISQGVAKERILSAKGFGEYRLLNKCSNGVPCSKEEHQLNRRSYFYISNNPGHIKVKNQVGE